MGRCYNGFTWKERVDGGAGIRRHLKEQGVPAYTGPCMLCGDPKVPLMIHAEDYAAPYSSGPPAFYWLCNHCHIHKLHKRFSQPEAWETFKAHVRRGGYAGDLKDPDVRREIRAYRAEKRKGNAVQLRTLRERRLAPVEWWDELKMDPAIAEPGYPRPVRQR